MINTETEFYTLRHQIGLGVSIVLTPNPNFRPRTATNAGASGSFKVEIESRFFYLPVARKLYTASALPLIELARLAVFTGTHAGDGLAVEAQAWAKRAVKALRSSALPELVSFVD